MHRFVLERGVQAFERDRTGSQRGHRADDGVVARARKGADLVARRPHGGRAASRDGRRLGLRIDAALEELLQPRVHGRQAEPPAQEREDAEGRQVPLVEDDRIAQGDRPAVVGRRIDQIENRLRPRPVPAVPVDRGRRVDGGCRQHVALSSQLSASSEIAPAESGELITLCHAAGAARGFPSFRCRRLLRGSRRLVPLEEGAQTGHQINDFRLFRSVSSPTSFGFFPFILALIARIGCPCTRRCTSAGPTRRRGCRSSGGPSSAMPLGRIASSVSSS